MARPRRWTAAGRLVGTTQAEQMALLPDPAAALEAAGWRVDLGGDETGRVWGHAHTGDDWVAAGPLRSVGAVYERLWQAVEARERGSD